MATDEELIDAVLKREGGFVDHSSDRGGPTKYGVTQATLSRWLGRPASVSDVQALAESEARAIYRQLYILEPGYHKITDDALRAFVVDAAVNHGPAAATKMLQRAVGVPDDGVLGDVTLGAIGKGTLPSVIAQRIRAYGRIISKDHSQAVFASGWLNRVAEFVEGLA